MGAQQFFQAIGPQQAVFEMIDDETIELVHPDGMALAADLALPGGDGGLCDASKRVVITDGAEWIRNTCKELFGDMTITFVLDVFHALQYASKAVNAIYRGKNQRKRLYEEFKASVLAGDAARVIRELDPLREQFKEAEECCRYFSKNLERIHYDQYRNDGLQIGSGVVKSGCKQVGARLKQTGARWLEKGANAMLALRTVVLNQRLTDFLDWRANQHNGVAA